MKVRKWTEAEDELLASTYPNATNLDELARRFGRTKHAIVQRASAKKILRTDKAISETIKKGRRKFGGKTNGSGNDHFGKPANIADGLATNEMVEFIWHGERVKGELVHRLERTMVVSYYGQNIVVRAIKNRYNYLQGIVPSSETIGWSKKIMAKN